MVVIIGILKLFPAYAGVILTSVAINTEITAFPRVCGGDPKVLENNLWTSPFSPRMRG